MKQTKTKQPSRLSSLIEGRWGWFIVIIAIIAVFAFKLISSESETLLRAQD